MPFVPQLLLAAIATFASPHARPAVVVVHANEFALRAPDAIRPGLTTFRLVNDGKLMHHVVVVKLPEGKTASDYLAAMQKEGQPPMWGDPIGGANPALPGATLDATLDMQPGNYVLVCFIPSPGDPTPHVMKGMVRPLIVRGEVRRASEREPDVTLTLRDYSFTTSVPLTAGSHLVRVTTDAAQPHEVVVVQMMPGHRIAEVGEWIEGGMKGPPPGRPIGGMSPISKGHSATFPLRLAPGTYGLICFIPDAKDGKPHFEHGMSQQFEVAAR